MAMHADAAAPTGQLARALPAFETRIVAETTADPSLRWVERYVRKLRVTDAIAVTAAVMLANGVQLSAEWAALTHAAIVGYIIAAAALIASWMGFIAVANSRDRRVVGSGPEEYHRIVSATLRLSGVVAIAGLLLQFEPARTYLVIAVPSGLVGLLGSRWLWRKSLVRQRLRGECVNRVLILGGGCAAVDLVESFQRLAGLGFRVVGMCIPDNRKGAGSSVNIGGGSVPVLGSQHDIARVIAQCGADTVAVTATEQLGAQHMRELAWQLEAVGADLVVHPGMVDVAAPRLKVRPVAGLPLLHVRGPQYDGANRWAKCVVDKVGALFLLLFSFPLMVLIAVAIKLTSRGPVLYSAPRVGTHGSEFTMLKFRSMVDDADQQLGGLHPQNEGAGPLFKIRRDPRVTRLGAVIRRYSLDELPQVFNVLRGDMSLVGPRPPLRSEVERYTGIVDRRMLVKPGMTGLWQVSGRSDLPWDEAVRLDLSYVENWSLMQDLIILWRTFRAVLRGKGAY